MRTMRGPSSSPILFLPGAHMARIITDPGISYQETLKLFHARHSLHDTLLSSPELPFYFSDEENRCDGDVITKDKLLSNFLQYLGIWFGPHRLSPENNVARIDGALQRYRAHDRMLERLFQFHFVQEYLPIQDPITTQSLNAPKLWQLEPKNKKERLLGTARLVAKFQSLRDFAPTRPALESTEELVNAVYGSGPGASGGSGNYPCLALTEFTSDTLAGLYFAHLMGRNRLLSPHVALTLEAFVGPAFRRTTGEEHRVDFSQHVVDWTEPLQLYQISEFVDGGTLGRVIYHGTPRRNQYFAWRFQAMFAIEQFNGLVGFFHGDAHSGNLMRRMVRPDSPYYNAAWVYIRPRRAPILNEHDVFVILPSVHGNEMIDLIDFGRSLFLHAPEPGVAMPEDVRTYADQLLCRDFAVTLGGAHSVGMKDFLAILPRPEFSEKDISDLSQIAKYFHMRGGGDKGESRQGWAAMMHTMTTYFGWADDEEEEEEEKGPIDLDGWATLRLFEESAIYCGRLKTVTESMLQQAAGGAKLVLISKWRHEESLDVDEIREEGEQEDTVPSSGSEKNTTHAETVKIWAEKPIDFIQHLVGDPAFFRKILADPELASLVLLNPTLALFVKTLRRKLEKQGKLEKGFDPTKITLFLRRWDMTGEEKETYHVLARERMPNDEKVRAWMVKPLVFVQVVSNDEETWADILRQPSLVKELETSAAFVKAIAIMRRQKKKRASEVAFLASWDSRHDMDVEEEDEKDVRVRSPRKKKARFQMPLCHLCQYNLGRLVETTGDRLRFCDSACQLLYHRSDVIQPGTALGIKADLH